MPGDTPVGIVDKVADDAIEVDVTIRVDNPSVVGDDRDRRDRDSATVGNTDIDGVEDSTIQGDTTRIMFVVLRARRFYICP